MTKPKTNRSVWLMIALLAGVVLVGGLLYAGLRTGRFEVAHLPRSDWGFGAQRYYLLFVGDDAPRAESIVYRLGVFSVTVQTRTRWPAGFDPRAHGAMKVR
jgi:hypothetical protein